MVLGKDIARLLGAECAQGFSGAAQVEKATLFGFLVPCLAVTVAIEAHAAVRLDGVLEHGLDCSFKFRSGRILAGLLLQLRCQVVNALGNDGVEDGVRPCNGTC